jgi:hypothetical protein
LGQESLFDQKDALFARILTVELQRDGSWGKTGHISSNCPTTSQDVNSSNGFCPKKGFNSGCNKPTFLLIIDNC